MNEQSDLFIAVAFRDGIAAPLTKPTDFKKAIWYVNNDMKYMKQHGLKNKSYPKEVTWDSYNVLSLNMWNDIPDNKKYDK